MNFIRPRILFFFAIFSSLQALAQDKIYTSSDQIPCKINDISPSNINYTTTKGKTADLALNKALIIFNQKGFFLIPQKLNFGDTQTDRLVKEYLNPTSTAEAKDYVYLNTQARYEGNIMNTQKKTVVIGTESGVVQVGKDDIAVTVYKDGRHEVNGSVKKAADILGAYQNIILPEVKEKPKPIGDVALAPVSSTTSTASSTQATPPVQKPAAAAVAATKNNTNPPVSQTSAPATTTEAPKKLAFEDVISNRSQEEFRIKATQKTEQLNTYLVIICDKKIDSREIDKAIDQALTLFVDENATVEISSVNRDVTDKKTIKKYLSHLKFVPYDRIELIWTQVKYVGEVIKGQDGNYYGTVDFDQVFKGYKDGKLVYEDITRKKTTVILKGYQKNVQGVTVDDWEVLLGDIGVEFTKSVTVQP